MELSRLVGNLPLKRQLSLETARRGLSHAYIISGPAGSGKRTLAGLLSAALVCTGGGDILCLCCSGCRKALGNIHPDVIHAGGEGDELNVARVRAIRNNAYIKPNEAPRKVYVLEGAQNMNDPSQNALLKLLEEGPAYAAFLLLTDNAAALLSTVRSRCEVLTLSPVTVQEAESYLAARYPDRSQAEISNAAARCEGILGRAVDQLEGRAADGKALEGAAALLERLCSRDELAILDFCAGLERDKWDRDSLSALLDEFLLLVRDCLVCAAGALHESDPRRRALAEQGAKALSPKVLTGAAALTEQLRTACGFYVGPGHIAGWLGAGLARLGR
ncbi:ATP-binding protein [uncultured Flavonifractor sp.]|uniref:DNA polymerase III subunit n=1 Tax=uncultured Flavonifractor sp. TaxID=1193534 RepID=UPI00261E39A5|nr:DNA polymerase III subunit delta [uncultured Flavonifractor sp.]